MSRRRPCLRPHLPTTPSIEPATADPCRSPLRRRPRPQPAQSPQPSSFSPRRRYTRQPAQPSTPAHHTASVVSPYPTLLAALVALTRWRHHPSPHDVPPRGSDTPFRPSRETCPSNTPPLLQPAIVVPDAVNYIFDPLPCLDDGLLGQLERPPRISRNAKLSPTIRHYSPEDLCPFV